MGHTVDCALGAASDLEGLAGGLVPVLRAAELVHAGKGNAPSRRRPLEPLRELRSLAE